LNTMALVPSKVIDKDYLFFWFKQIDLSDLSNGTSIPQINNYSFNDVHISYPKSLSEQQRIVVTLDLAFAAIAKAKANAEQNLKNAKELFESYLQGVFETKGEGWDEKKLSDLCDTGAGGTPLKSHKDYYEGGNVPWLRSGEVDKKDIIECELYITEKGLKNSSARLFPKNTVLIAMYGATAGQVGILRFECSTNQAVCGILPNKNIIPEFLYYKFTAGKKALVEQAVGGAQPNISQIKIKNSIVPNISLREQQTIIQKLDALSLETKKLEAIYQQKINDLEELKKSVLQKAFAGELKTK
jgi:type I restriction enzyme S subunit